MNDVLKQAQSELQQWRDRAIEEGWLQERVGAGLDLALAKDPAQLFSGVEQRPLIVSFFGGTGVGKSTLLNRLAGVDIARTGVVRPTSREVTIHAHESLTLSQLPAQIPADKVQMSNHSDAESSHVVWIDTPDVDSVATEHRDQVLAWLPYVDLVIYVVSPERYKDDAGWRMVREAGDRHAWMFVLNQWDRGQPEQLTDFKRVLREAGFADPQVFCTVSNGAEVADDFEALRSAVEQLGKEDNVSALVQQAEAAQAEQLREGTENCLKALGADGTVEQINIAFEADFEDRSAQIIENMSWQINAMAQRFQEEQGGWRQLISGQRAPLAVSEASADGVVWDARTEQQVQDALAELVVTIGQQQLPQQPLRKALALVADRSADVLARHQRAALSTALEKPGTRLQHWLFNAVATAATVGPIIALAWIGFRVVMSFYNGDTVDGEYVGGNFAINSVLLLGVAWLLPALLREKVRPSLSAAVGQALRWGSERGLAEVAAEATACTRAFDQKRIALREEAWTIAAVLPNAYKEENEALAALRPLEK